jgi:hypothetical protein
MKSDIFRVHCEQVSNNFHFQLKTLKLTQKMNSDIFRVYSKIKILYDVEKFRNEVDIFTVSNITERIMSTPYHH